MKKIIAVLSALSLLLISLTGCSFNIQNFMGNVEKVNVTPTEKEKTNYTWTSAYAEIIEICRSRYGDYAEVKNEDGEIQGATGVFFCNMLDWNADSSPELLVGYCDENDSDRITDFEVYTFSNGYARPILNEKPGTDSDGNAQITLVRSENGEYKIIVSHSTDNSAKNDYSIYTFNGTNVECTTLYYGTVAESTQVKEEETTTEPETTTAPAEEEAEETTDDEAEEEETQAEETTTAQATTVKTASGNFNYYSITGRSCSREEFNNALSEARQGTETVIYCTHASDISVLFAFLSGTAAQYTDEISGVSYSSAAK